MLALGIDVGGTAIKAGLVSSKGEIIIEKKVLTKVAAGKEQVIRQIEELSLALVEEAGQALSSLAGIGIGIPGFVNYEKGEVLFAPNLKWQQTPLKAILQADLELPVFLDNDVNAAALGELYYGAGQGCRNFIMLTIGTGLGGAIINEGQLLRGSIGMAGEVGHMIIHQEGDFCGCGQRGCLETLTSATAILKEAKKRELAVTQAKEVFFLAEQGNKAAQEIIEKAAFYLGLGLINLISLLNPEAVIIGGGVSIAGETLFKPLQKTLHQLASGPAIAGVRILPAKLGNRAGIIGSSSLVFSTINDALQQ